MCKIKIKNWNFLRTKFNKFISFDIHLWKPDKIIDSRQAKIHFFCENYYFRCENYYFQNWFWCQTSFFTLGATFWVSQFVNLYNSFRPKIYFLCPTFGATTQISYIKYGLYHRCPMFDANTITKLTIF